MDWKWLSELTQEHGSEILVAAISGFYVWSIRRQKAQQNYLLDWQEHAVTLVNEATKNQFAQYDKLLRQERQASDQLRERLGQLDRQVSRLQQGLNRIKTLNNRLERRNKALIEQNQALLTENMGLRQQLHNFPRSSNHEQVEPPEPH